MKVDLHKRGCFHQRLVCNCLPPPDYADQMQLEIYVSGFRYNVLTVKSEINMDFLVVERSQEWIDGSLPIIDRFYEKYMAWYWEDDESKTQPIREFLEWYNVNVVDKWNADAKHTIKRTHVNINALLKRRPTVRIKRKLEKEEEETPNKRLKTRDENEWLSCEVVVEDGWILKCLYKQRDWTMAELVQLDESLNSHLIV